MALPVQVVADGRDISALIEDVTFSNVDPGGYEMASVTPRAGLTLRPGTPLVIRYGLSYAWHGRILDPGDYDKHGISSRQLGAVGYGHRLDDNPYSTIYVDRDLSRWTGPSTSRQVTLLNAGYTIAHHQVLPDVTGGLPSIDQQFIAPWALIECDSMYDAGAGNLISSVYYDMSSPNVGSSWARSIYAMSDDAFTNWANVWAGTSGGSASGYATAVTGWRWFMLRTYFNAAVPGGTQYDTYWRYIAVYGDHGLSRQGPDPGGFYPSDIALHALVRSGAGFRAQIISADSYIVSHYVQYVPIGASTVIGDMAKLMAWHWGVWEPGGAFDDRPVLIFAPPPADATAVIDRYRCDAFAAPRVDYDKLYNMCQVKYADAAGTVGLVEVSMADGRLDASGVTRRVLGPLDMGVGSAASAQAYGIFALRLAQRAARSGGSVTIKGNAALPAGGSIPAALLRSGRDRVRLLGLNDGGDLFASDVRALDSFLVRRVETTATADGSLSTRIDFDEGVDLIEVLTARLQAAATVAGR